MFSGLVEQIGTVTAVEVVHPGKRLTVDAARIAVDARIGDSLSVSGCCLTVVDVQRFELSFEAGPETLARTNLGQLSIGSTVNLERSLTLADRLGGHLVTGHVDGTGRIARRTDQHEWSEMWFEFPIDLASQIASKGSIAVDGISLTVVDAQTDRFSVALIPHTLRMTTLGEKRVGDTVNLETDLLAKYVARQFAIYLMR